MKIDKSKLNVIGIDRIVLNDIDILNFDTLDFDIVNDEKEQKKQIKIKDEFFKLFYSRNINKNTGEIYNTSLLEFNPIKIYYGHNIYNSDIKQLERGLNYIKETLSIKGIKIDFSKSKIKEIELNITIAQNFIEFSEIFELIGSANHKSALSISSFLNKDIPKEMVRTRTLYLNPLGSKKSSGKTIKIYDKTYELMQSREMFIEEELTRVEILLGSNFLKSMLKKNGLSNDLKDFTNDDIIEKIYKESLVKEFVIKPMNYIENLKKDLRYKFKNFKRNEKVKREYREKLKAQGKEIPEEYKEERGVFEYLKKESWIFDACLLSEIVQKEVSTKDRKAYQIQIEKKYKNIKNFSIYKDFLKKVKVL